MKWTSKKQRKAKPIPKLGEYRNVFKYAWFPIETETYWVWREIYVCIQTYRSIQIQDESITIFGFRRGETTTYHTWGTIRKLALDYYNHHGTKENTSI